MSKRLRQEAIKKAYGKYWDKVKRFVDENGFYIDDGEIPFEVRKDFDISILRGCRPKELIGVYYNRGWLYAKPSNMDSKRFDCFFIVKGTDKILIGEYFPTYDEFRKGNKCYGRKEVSHFKPIETQNLPLW